MTHERCECGGEGWQAGIAKRWISCDGKDGNECWQGPMCDTVDEAWSAWDRVMLSVRVIREMTASDEKRAEAAGCSR